MADEIRRLIRVRTQKGARFKRDGFGKKRQLADSWRKPRGQHNKQREQKKAKGALPKPGFGSPTAVRGMHPSGFFEVLVHTTDDLEGLNPKTQSIRIAATVGSRKRILIQKKALAAGLRVLNARAGKPEKKAPAAKKEEKAGKKEQKKAIKAVPEKKAPAAKKEEKPGKKEKPAEKKAAAPEEGVPSKKKVQDTAQPEKARKKDGQKKKTQKTSEASPESKQKKGSKVKEEPAVKDAKPDKKAAAKPKKKAVKEGEEQ